MVTLSIAHGIRGRTPRPAGAICLAFLQQVWFPQAAYAAARSAGSCGGVDPRYALARRWRSYGTRLWSLPGAEVSSALPASPVGPLESRRIARAVVAPACSRLRSPFRLCRSPLPSSVAFPVQRQRRTQASEEERGPSPYTRKLLSVATLTMTNRTASPCGPGPTRFRPPHPARGLTAGNGSPRSARRAAWRAGLLRLLPARRCRISSRRCSPTGS